jgi:hypothetical protein
MFPLPPSLDGDLISILKSPSKDGGKGNINKVITIYQIIL